MPIIPVDRNLISTGVPGTDASSPGGAIVNSSLATFGQQVAQNGLALDQQLRVQEARDASESAFNQDQIDSEGYYNKLKISSPDGYVYDDNGKKKVNTSDGSYRTISQEYRDWANDKFKKNQDAMPNLIAQDAYKSKASTFFSSQISASMNDENNLKIESYKTNMIQRDQSKSDSLASNGSLARLYQLSNDSRLEWQEQAGKLFSKPIADAANIKNNQQFAQSTVDYAVGQVLSTPKTGDAGFSRKAIADQWLKYLDEDPNNLNTLSLESRTRKLSGMPIMSEMLNPDQKTTLRDKLIAALKTSNEYDMGRYNALKKEAEADAYLGKNRTNWDYLINFARQGVAAGKMSQEEASQDISSFKMNKVVGSLDDSLALMAPAQRDPYIKRKAAQVVAATQSDLNSQGGNPSQSGQVGSVAEKEILQKAEEKSKALQTESDADWPQYLVNHKESSALRRDAILAKNGASVGNPQSLIGMGPALRDAINGSDGLYKLHYGLDYTKHRIVSKDDAQAISDFLDSNKISQEVKAQGLRIYANEYKDKWPLVMQDIIKDKKLNERWDTATQFAGSQAQTEDRLNAISMNLDSTEIKSFLDNKGISKKDLYQEVGDKFGAYFEARSQEDPGAPFSQAKKDGITDTAVSKMITLLQTGRATSESDAAQKAYDSLILENNHVLEYAKKDTGIFGYFQAKNKINIPKQIQGLPVDEVSANKSIKFIEDFMTVDNLKKAGIVPPKMANGKDSYFGEEFYKQVLETGRAYIDPRNGNINVRWRDSRLNKDNLLEVKRDNGTRGVLSIPFWSAVQGTAATQKPKKLYRPGG